MGIYICFALFGCFGADHLIFFPHKSTYQDTSEIIKITTGNDAEISAIYVKNPHAKFTMLFSSGNAEDLGDVLPFLESMQAHGYSIFAYDYQGYGTSTGRPSEKNTYKDIDAAYKYLVEQISIPPDRIIIHGRSLGSAVSIDLASRTKVAGLIIQSSFTTAFRVVTRIPLIPFDKFKNIDKIKSVHCPVLLMHGAEDTLIPLWHSKKLYKAANTPKRKLWVPRAGHNNLTQTAGPTYWTTISDFIEKDLTQ